MPHLRVLWRAGASPMLIRIENTAKLVVDVLFVFLLVLGAVSWNIDDAIHLLQVEPPLVLIVGFSVSEEIVKPYRKAPR